MKKDFHKIKSLLLEDSIDAVKDDVDYFICRLNNLKFFNSLSDNRRCAIIALCFLYGIQGLLSKTKLMISLESQDFERAFEEIMSQDDKFKQIAYALKDDIIT